MNPRELERQIAEQSDAMREWYDRARAAHEAGMGDYAIEYRRQARNAAREVGRLVAMRTPETVARMERIRGLV